jgi:hypothetical protein
MHSFEHTAFSYSCLTFKLTLLYKWRTRYKVTINNTSCVVFVTELPHGWFKHFVIRRYVTHTADTVFLSNLRWTYEQIFVLPSFFSFSCSFIDVASRVFQFTIHFWIHKSSLRMSEVYTDGISVLRKPLPKQESTESQRRGRKSYIHTRKRFQTNDPNILAT